MINSTLCCCTTLMQMGLTCLLYIHNPTERDHTHNALQLHQRLQTKTHYHPQDMLRTLTQHTPNTNRTSLKPRLGPEQQDMALLPTAAASGCH